MFIGLIIVLLLLLALPFLFRFIEHNLEYFLFVMGISATVISGALSIHLLQEILSNSLLYLITAAVLIAGLIFRLSVNKIKEAINFLIVKTSLKIFIFCLIFVLGIISSFITAIITALILVEIVHALPFKHKNKVLLTVIACFSIGLGAALTPLGEPLSTLVVSALKVDFFYILKSVGIYIIPGIFALAIFGAFYIEKRHKHEIALSEAEEENLYEGEALEIIELEKLSAVFMRAFKIFIFVIALEMLGKGFKPLIDTYVIMLDSRILYWFNISSAVLDNATLAAAEISQKMSLVQIKSVLMGLLISGGMLIPGNIPNIISAGKLNIKSREWAVVGLPIGGILMVVYFIILNLR